MDGQDGNVSMPSSNKEILLDGQNNGEGQDRISSLPAKYSFIPSYKIAVGTSILSTKWKYLWTSVSKLDFCDGLLYSTNKSTEKDSMLATTFKNFVNRVFLLLDGLTIDDFVLWCTAAYDHTDINVWITTLLRSKVQQLILYIPLKGAFVFPRCLFSCESLTVLNIDLNDFCYFRVPTSTCFPSLKVMHLNRVTVCAAEHSVQEVYFSFPVLDDFSAYQFKAKINIVTISATLLTQLTMEDCENESIQECEIVIYAKSLTFLELNIDLSCKYSLYNLLSLVSATIDVYCSTTTIVDRVIKLLAGICNVKDLNLSKRTIDSLFCVEDTLVHLPTFSSLVWIIVTPESGDIDASNLMSLLHKMPRIEHLIFCAPYTFNN